MSEASISYVSAVPDKGDYFALFETTGWNREYGRSADQLHEAIRSSWYLLSAYDEERLVGFGRVISDGVLHALIVDLIVLPEYQGMGIGSHILTQLTGRCMAHRIADVQLFCAKGKAGFYQKRGFVTRPSDAPGMELRSPAGLS